MMPHDISSHEGSPSAKAHSTSTFSTLSPHTPSVGEGTQHFQSPAAGAVTPTYSPGHTRSVVSTLQQPPSVPSYFSPGGQEGPAVASPSGTAHRSPRRSAWAASFEDDEAAQQSARARQQLTCKDTRRLSLEHPRTKGNPAYTTRPIGDPVVRELNPVSPSQLIRLKHRAATLIQRYAGNNWQVAQRTKWMLDVVTHIDKDYREYIMEQAFQIQHLQQQIEVMQSSQAGALALAQTQASELEDLARHQQAQLRQSAACVLDLQTRLAESEATLTVAEQAAHKMASEVAELQRAVGAITEHDARARKMLANRAHGLKEALRGSQARVRHASEVMRKHKVEVTAMLQLKDEEIVREKGALTTHFMNQIAAVHQVERAAGKVEADHLRLELEAYKEPWVRQYGKISPTHNKELAISLGLQPASLNTVLASCT